MFEIVEAKQRTRNARTVPSRSFYARSRVHVFQDKESVLGNLENRRSRPSKLYKEVVLQQYPELKGKLSWSQTAGCSCGCSPGFIVNETLRDEAHNPIDLYITARFN